MVIKHTRRRSVALSPEVHMFLDQWQARERATGRTGNAPISALFDKLLRRTAMFRRWAETGQLPGEVRT